VVGEIETELERIDRRITRQEDLFNSRDQVVRDLVSEFKTLNRSIQSISDRVDKMPNDFANICDSKIGVHRAQYCEQHEKNEKNREKQAEEKRAERKPDETLLRIIILLTGIIGTLLGVKVGF